MKISKIIAALSKQQELEQGKKVEEEHKTTIEYLMAHPDTPVNCFRAKALEAP